LAGVCETMIYDCFIFFNELDLLELRLNILDAVVDKFVLVEATRTFQGKEKPLFFSDNKHRFKDFLGKIIHVVVAEYPDNPEQEAWRFECHQRSGIQEGLRKCDPSDVILISDVDEIPDPVRIREVMNDNGVKIFRQRMFYYFLNCVNAGGAEGDMAESEWTGTVMTRYADIGDDVGKLRELPMATPAVDHRGFPGWLCWKFWIFRNSMAKGQAIRLIDNGGWHFSFLGGVEKIIDKLEAFSHVEYNKKEFKDPKKIREAIDSGEDILGRRFRYRFIPLDSTFPEYLLNNREKYKHLIRQVAQP